MFNHCLKEKNSQATVDDKKIDSFQAPQIEPVAAHADMVMARGTVGIVGGSMHHSSGPGPAVPTDSMHGFAMQPIMMQVWIRLQHSPHGFGLHGVK